MKKTLAMVMVVCLFAGTLFGDVWQDLAQYKYGEGNAADEADKLLQRTPVEGHGAIEDALIAVVTAKDATQDGKAFACRLLQQIGTETCIPALGGLLHDDVLSHYARLALQRMGTPAADEVMRAALDQAPDTVKIGILGSLAQRRDEQAVKQITKLVEHGDPAVAAAALSALGQIGGASAAKCLSTWKPADHLMNRYMVALLDCAPSLEASRAVSLYEIVLAGRTRHRTAALRGMLAADENKAVALMVDFIKGDDVKMCSGVLTLVAVEKSEHLTKAMVDVLGTLPDEKKTALITVLGARGDKAAMNPISGYVTSTNERLRDAAVTALGKIGDAGSVRLLLGLDGGSRDAITKMSGQGVHDALVKALEDNPLKVSAIRAMVARNDQTGVPNIFALLKDADAEVRKAAWDGLGSLGSDDDMVGMAKAAFAIQDEGEVSCAVAAVRTVCAYAADKATCFDVIIAYYDDATDASKSTIVELASLVGSPSALELVKKAMISGNQDLYRKAVRSLAAWCCENAVDELLELAKRAPEEVDRVLALRGYIRLAGEGPNLNEDQRAEMFKQAAALAKRVEERKLIAGHLRRAPNAVALVIANTYLDDPAVREEVEQSAVDIAEHLQAEKMGSDDLVKEVAYKLLSSKNGGFVNRMKRTLAEMGEQGIE